MPAKQTTTTAAVMLHRRNSSSQSLPDSASDDATIASQTPSENEHENDFHATSFKNTALTTSAVAPLPSLSSFVLAPFTAASDLARYACIKSSIASPVYTFGEARAPGVTIATIRVLKRAFWPRLAVYSALGFGESFMFNEVEVDGLTDLIIIFIRNRKHLAAMEVLPFNLNSLLNAIIHSKIPNTIYNSLLNIQAHYDLGNEMFESFLDPTMTYSCPIWELGNEHESLESAQLRKIHRMLELAEIRKGDHVLEIGTGWGALGIEAVKLYDCHVTTLTLSKEQKALAEARIAKAGFSDRITVLLQDYRLMNPSTHGQFDRIVTVEMLEAVGAEFMPTFFAKMDQLLKPDGILSLQVITIADERFKAYTQEIDYIQKYIFPGGQCPCVASLTDAIYKGSEGRLFIDELHNIGPHYSKALRLWREAFMDKFDEVRDATGLHHVYTNEFRRRWEYYFAYCEAGFATRGLGDIQPISEITVMNDSILQQIYPNDSAPEENNFPRWMPEDGPYGPPIHTSIHRVRLALQLAECTSTDVVLDLGCGDGRFCVSAVLEFNVRKALGIDSDAACISQARDALTSVVSNACQVPVDMHTRVTFYEKDIRDTAWLERVVVEEGVSVLVAFLTPEFSRECEDWLVRVYERGVTVVAVCFDLANLKGLKLKEGFEGGVSGVDGIWVYKKSD
ncbi:hypothetical protein CcCBS67573_g03626 [Chytriomyces confervae]|uniref:Cyclopropane-fatty-acyl-phospholipid synthase n=1 Tax=Chytriomyces confervae TaxID=246404 RepID=A0A507FJ52_9FUNG|nr:hypothetical protein CcCBS67573_g03626 [Chytriomyces confervae]